MRRTENGGTRRFSTKYKVNKTGYDLMIPENKLSEKAIGCAFSLLNFSSIKSLVGQRPATRWAMPRRNLASSGEMPLGAKVKSSRFCRKRNAYQVQPRR